MNKKFRILFSQAIPKEKLEALPIKELKVQGNAAIFNVLGSDNLKNVQTALKAMPVVSVEPTPMTLEEVFLSEMEAKTDDINEIFS